MTGEYVIIDIHNHIGLSRDGGHSKLKDIIANMAEYKIMKLVLFAIDEEQKKATHIDELIDKIHQEG